MNFTERVTQSSLSLERSTSSAVQKDAVGSNTYKFNFDSNWGYTKCNCVTQNVTHQHKEINFIRLFNETLRRLENLLLNSQNLAEVLCNCQAWRHWLANFFFATLAYLLLFCTSARCLYIVWVEGQICVDSREEVARFRRHRISL